MNAKIKITLITFLTLIICSINVYSTENFVAATNNYQTEICKCGNAQNTIEIGNTGEITNIYVLYQAGDAAKFSILSEPAFNIEGGQIKKIVDVINIPCDTKTGDYTLNTYITSGLGQKKVLKQIITIKECKIVIQKNITTNKTIQNQTTITNKTQTNTTTITNQTKQENKTTQEKNEITILTKEVIINKTTDKNFNIQIQNKADTKTSINLTIKGPEWVTTKTTTTELQPNQTKNITLNLNLTNTTKDGNYKITLEAKNANKTITTKNVNLIVGNQTFNTTHFLIGLLAVIIIIAIIALIVSITNKKQEEEPTEDIRIEEVIKKPQKTTKKKAKKSRKKRKR